MNILALNFTRPYLNILQKYENNGNQELFRLESVELGMNHLEVGVAVMKAWDMPENFTDVIRSQDFFPSVLSRVNDVDRVTRLAEILAKSILGLNLSSDDKKITEGIKEFYKFEHDLPELFNEDYYENIKSHPFFEAFEVA
jgi:HD-like signal output (HDOD) protein